MHFRIRKKQKQNRVFAAIKTTDSSVTITTQIYSIHTNGAKCCGCTGHDERKVGCGVTTGCIGRISDCSKVLLVHAVRCVDGTTEGCPIDTPYRTDGGVGVACDTVGCGARAGVAAVVTLHTIRNNSLMEITRPFNLCMSSCIVSVPNIVS